MVGLRAPGECTDLHRSPVGQARADRPTLGARLAHGNEGSIVGETDGGRVDLGHGTSASRVMHQILLSTVDEFPDDLGSARPPRAPEDFKATYAESVPRFEAARIASPRRSEIARYLASASQRSFLWATGEDEQPLTEAMAEPASPLDLDAVAGQGSGGWIPEIPTAHGAARGGAIRDYVAGLSTRAAASPGVVDAVEWMLDHAADSSGVVDLSDRRIVLLGGAAELAPAAQWLAAGADVLWLDIAPPPEKLRRGTAGSGRLRWAADGADLLTQPRRIAATIAAAAADGPVDLGLYAYAPGRGQEWRLTATMNAIIGALPVTAVRSVTILVSPTTPAELTPADLATEHRRFEERPRWQRTLQRARLLGSGSGHVDVDGHTVSRSIVTIQGAGYQAAQYFEKMMTAETWATWGRPLAPEPHPLHVSANVAGVSQTQSLQHPVFDAAFGGATAFEVETFAPATTQALNALLTAHDLLDPRAPGNPAAEYPTEGARAQALLTTARVHGGLYVLPYPADAALRVSAVIGAGRNPGRIPSMVRGAR